MSGAADDVCAASFVETFGAKVFRRPLTDTERQWFLDLYTAAAAGFTFSDTMDVVLARMLQAPEFLYLPEVGEPIEGAPDSLRRILEAVIDPAAMARHLAGARGPPPRHPRPWPPDQLILFA